MLSKDVESLITCGGEIEMTHFNSRFKGYETFDGDQQLKIRKNAKSRARRILGRVGLDIIEAERKINKELDYALQFL